MFRRAPVLPDNCMANWLTRFTVPNNGCLTLIRDANGRNLIATQPRAGERFRNHACLRGPDFIRVMFHPARLRIILCKLLLCDRPDRPGMIEDDCARTRSALIDS
ncbi:MAG: hypothetical protein JWQ71_2283 [Pedosphaera sp.]|nr:hypothetical protein [Pedosphaera sp.]